MPGISSAKAKEANLVGAAGVCFVAGELMSRMMNVSWPLTDEGWDLMAKNGCRIQVKTARLRNVAAWGPESIYSFHFAKRRFMATSSGSVRERAPQVLSERCDVVVLVGLEQKRYWVVPAKLLDKVQCALMGPSMERDFEDDMPHIRDMVNYGFSQQEIATYYGVRQSSIGRRLQKSGTPRNVGKFAGPVRAYENAWSEIVNFGRPAAVNPLAAETMSIAVGTEA